MCNFHSELARPLRPRDKGFMSTGLAKKIIDQIGSLERPSWVAFHGAGESLLHKNLIDILSYCKAYDSIQTGLLTNGMLLTKNLGLELIDSGISWIGFSIDGVNKLKFERFRKGSDYERIVENVLAFLQLKEARNASINTKVNMTVQDEMENDVDDFIDFWIDKVDEVLVSPCRPIGTRTSQIIDTGRKRIPCYMLYEVMVIFWDGKVPLCCEDWFNVSEMGDVKRNSIIEIWDGETYNSIRSLHERGLYDGLSLCKDCSSWINSVPERYFDHERRCNAEKNSWQYTYRKVKKTQTMKP